MKRRGIRVPLAFLEWFTPGRSLVVLAAVGGPYAWLLHRAALHDDWLGASGLVRIAPLVAGIVAPAIIGLVVGFVRWSDERAWAPVQGDHHAFDDHPIRVVEARGTLWFSSADVHAAVGLPRSQAMLRALRRHECRRDDAIGEALSVDGLTALLGRSTDRRALRLLRWADGDVRRPWQKRRDARRDATHRSHRDAAASSDSAISATVAASVSPPSPRST